jgi:hypothetical protein
VNRHGSIEDAEARLTFPAIIFGRLGRGRRFFCAAVVTASSRHASNNDPDAARFAILLDYRARINLTPGSIPPNFIRYAGNRLRTADYDRVSVDSFAVRNLLVDAAPAFLLKLREGGLELGGVIR